MTTVKKNHWLKFILPVVIACAVAGLILAIILFNQNPGRTYASASLQFSFKGAGEGKAPTGYPFDVNDIFSDEVLTNALDASGLSNTYTKEQIKDNLTITGVYPENIVKQMTAYHSLLDADAVQQTTMADYHATLYSVVLYQDFDPQIKSDQLISILSNILEAYRTYFTKTCAFSLEKPDPITNLSEYDYTYQLMVIDETIDQQSRFAREMADQAPDFRQDSKGFDDIVVSYSSLKNDIDRLNAAIALNTISKAPDRLQEQYRLEIQTLNHELDGALKEKQQIDELISTYEKNGIVYISTSGKMQKIPGNTSDTYDQLVARRQELTDDISSINAEAAKYQALLGDLSTSNHTESSTENEETVNISAERTEEEQKQLAISIEAQIQNLTAKKDKVASGFATLLDTYARQELNESTVFISNLSYKRPSLLSGRFAMKLLKTAGPICTIGLIICIIVIIHNKRKESKT